MANPNQSPRGNCSDGNKPNAPLSTTARVLCGSVQRSSAIANVNPASFAPRDLCGREQAKCTPLNHGARVVQADAAHQRKSKCETRFSRPAGTVRTEASQMHPPSIAARVLCGSMQRSSANAKPSGNATAKPSGEAQAKSGEKKKASKAKQKQIARHPRRSYHGRRAGGPRASALRGRAESKRKSEPPSIAPCEICGRIESKSKSELSSIAPYALCGRIESNTQGRERKSKF